MPIPLTQIQRQCVQDNIGLAYLAANRRYYKLPHGSLTLDEIVSASFQGLINGVIHYKYDLSDIDNKRWCAYILKYCDSAIIDEIKNNKLIHVPFYLYNKNKWRSKTWKGRINTNKFEENKLKAKLYFEGINESNLIKEKFEETKNIDIKDYYFLLTFEQIEVVNLRLTGLTFEKISKVVNKTKSACSASYRKSVKLIRNFIK